MSDPLGSGQRPGERGAAQQSTLNLGDHQAQQPPAYGQAPFAQPPGPAGGAPWGAPPPQQGFPQHGFPQQGYPQPGYGHPGPSGSAYGFPQQPPPGPGGYPEFKYDDALPGYSQAQSGQPYNAQQQYYFSNQPGTQQYYQQPMYVQQQQQASGFSFLGSFPIAFAMSFMCGVFCPAIGPACVVCCAPTPEGKAGASAAYSCSLILWGISVLIIYPVMFGSYSVDDCVQWQLEHNAWAKTVTVDYVRSQCQSTKNSYISFGAMSLVFGVILGALTIWLMKKIKAARQGQATARSADSNIELEDRS